MRLALNGWFLGAPATGTGQYLRQLASALSPFLREAGGELALIAPHADPTVDAPVHIAPPRLSGNLGKVEFEHLTYPRSCTQGHFTIAHVPHFGPPLYPSIPTIVTIHDLIPMVLPAYRSSLLVRAYTALAAQAACRARLILADSEASRRDILARLPIPPERVRVVYLAADQRFHPADAMEIARVRSKYALPERFVLYLGGFDLRKNVRVLVSAFHTLEQERGAGWKLVLAGRLPERDTPFFPDPRAGAGERIQCIGYVPEEDKPALYAAAHLFAFPSLYEGFGLPPLEAMACGTPVLCADTSSLPEVVGKAGILLDPTRVEVWADALRALMNSESQRKELRNKGLAQAKRFSWEKTARETWQAYQSVALAQNPRRVP
ncbi:MAG: glycosyltransferase family 1 protein [Anaerolineae bacterium]